MIAAQELAASPSWFPLDPAGQSSIRLVRLDEAAYRAASFLDLRIRDAGREETLCDIEVLRAAAVRLRPRLHYIFHTGHVGSTLVSRLIGEHDSFFSLREPALLREFAAPGRQRAGALTLEILLALLARTWRPGQRAVLKATSFLSERSDAILARSEHPAAIFMFAQPVAYVQGILGGPNSRIEARTLAPSRLERLVRRLGPGPWQAALRSEGEYLAMSWLSEMAALHQAASAQAATAVSVSGSQTQVRVRWLDFDRFLAQPARGLEDIFRTLGAIPDPQEIEALVTGPLMGRYSKAPEHAYDAALRREVLATADLQYGAEIRRGMDWLNGMAVRHPLVAQVLEQAAVAGGY